MAGEAAEKRRQQLYCFILLESRIHLDTFILHYPGRFVVFFLDWWFRQFLKASIWLNTKLKKLWNWHFCSPNNMNFSLVLSFHTYSKYVSDTSFSAVSSDKSPHCIRDLHTKADSWIFLGLPLIPFPSVNSSFKISYVKRYSTDV